MLTAAEKNSLALTVSFLLLGGGLKAWPRLHGKLGPFQDTVPADSSRLPGKGPEAAPHGDAPRTDQASDGAHAVQDGAGPDDEADSVPANAPDPLLARIEAALPDHPRAGPRGPASGSPKRKSGGTGHPSGRKAPPAGGISLNRATAAELAEIPGIGAKTALAILEYRRSHGGIMDLRELVNVKGIGEKKLERIAPYLIISPIREVEPPRQALLPPESGSE